MTTEKTTEQAEKTGVAQNVEGFLKEQLAQAQKRLEGLEAEANKALKTLESKGQEAAKEVQSLWGKLQAGELLADPRVQQLGKKVDAAGTELRKRLDTLQARVVEAVGVASQSQVQQLNRELSKLSKKLDVLLKPARRVNGAAKGSGSSASAPRA